GGYIKYLQTTTVFPKMPLVGNMLTDNFIHNRLNFRWYPARQWTVAVEARNRLFYGEQVKLFNTFGSFSQRIDQYEGLVDLSVIWLDEEAALLHSIVDRAYLNWAGEKWEVRLGRQRINWGINLAWNPNDLFNPLNFLDFDYEERPGRDALRVQYFPGLMSSVELAFAPAKKISNSIGAALYKFNLGTYDIQLLAGYARGDLAFGGGWAGYIGGAGFKGEATYYSPTGAATDTLGRAFIFSTALDYQFGNGIYATASVLYNSKGQGLNNGATQGPLLLGGSSTVSSKNLFPGKWAYLLQASRQLHPLVSLSVAGLYTPTDNLSIFFPTITYSIKENWDLDLVAQAALADQNEAYRHLGTSLFFRLKWSY
ncbi:MAG: hypothetical protein D6730_14425, partial [Bacteroidetes bacterium]